jgi:hypothetical protein
MPTVQRSTLESNAVPSWLYAPSNIRLEQPAGVHLELLTIIVASSEARKEAALIGIFRNRGRALTGALLTLSYMRSDGESIVHSVSNAAQVSEVPVDGILPFRFPLLSRADLPEELLVFRVEVGEGMSGGRRSLSATLKDDYAVRDKGENGVVVTGEIEIDRRSGLPHPDTDEVFVTVVLLDKNGSLLDVLAGSPTSRTGSDHYRIELQSMFPIGSRVKNIQVYVERSGLK